MVVARGGAFESAAILEYLNKINLITEDEFITHIKNLEEISKMLFSLIQHLDKH